MLTSRAYLLRDLRRAAAEVRRVLKARIPAEERRFYQRALRQRQQEIANLETIIQQDR